MLSRLFELWEDVISRNVLGDEKNSTRDMEDEKQS
jgi:hypothetical protein